jgi:hypothetical protein
MHMQQAKALSAKLHAASRAARKAQRNDPTQQQNTNTGSSSAGPSDYGSSVFGLDFVELLDFSMPGLEDLD